MQIEETLAGSQVVAVSILYEDNVFRAVDHVLEDYAAKQAVLFRSAADTANEQSGSKPRREERQASCQFSILVEEVVFLALEGDHFPGGIGPASGRSGNRKPRKRSFRIQVPGM